MSLTIGIIWKDFITWVCMPNMTSLTLAVQKLWQVKVFLSQTGQKLDAPEWNKNFNLYDNFWASRGRAFIIHMCISSFYWYTIFLPSDLDWGFWLTIWKKFVHNFWTPRDIHIWRVYSNDIPFKWCEGQWPLDLYTNELSEDKEPCLPDGNHHLIAAMLWPRLKFSKGQTSRSRS